ncbi:MAG: hypothetical protein IJV71_09505 [Lachnospiraceae bacterium]|nr:hypothetical protein [Lachnospiraceae bacterium]
MIDLKIYDKIIKKSKYIILLVVCFLLFTGDIGIDVLAAQNVDKDAECSLLLKVPNAYKEELKDEVIPIRLYRIADVTDAGTFADLDGYESLGLSQLSMDATAKELEDKAAEVVDYLKADEGKGDTVASPYRTMNIENNQAGASDLETGMYLLYMNDYKKGDDRYSALPYIIFLPASFQWQDADGNNISEWNYNLIAELKFSKNGRGQNPVDPITPPQTPEDNPEGEKTGDMTNVEKYYGIAIFFGLVFIIVFLSRRRHKAVE